MSKIGTITEEDESVMPAPEEGSTDPEISTHRNGGKTSNEYSTEEEAIVGEAARLEILRSAVEEMKSILSDSQLPNEAKVTKLRTSMANARRHVLQIPGAPSDESRLAALFKAKVGEVRAAMDNPETTEAKIADALKLEAAHVREVMADPESRAKIFGKSCQGF